MFVEALRQKSDFTPDEFACFREVITNFLLQPENRIAFDGPGSGSAASQRKIDYEEWLDSFLDGGIGSRYWGPGTERKWSFPHERTQIRVFLREAVLLAANTARRNQRTGSVMLPIGQPLNRLESGSVDPPSQDLSIQQSQGHSQENSSAPGSIDSTTTITNPPKRPRGRLRKTLSTIIVTGPTVPKTLAKPPTKPPAKTQSLKRKMTTRGMATSRTRHRRATTAISPDSDDDYTDTLYPNPNPSSSRNLEKQTRLKFTLETSLKGRSVKVACGVHLPTLDDLVEMMHEKHDLAPRQEIQSIEVKTGRKVFDMDMDESQFQYIWEVIAKNGGRAEVIVMVSEE